MLEDRFGREFHYLRLSITDVCNFRCNYCLPDGYEGRPDEAFLSLDEIRRIASAFAATGTSKIRITGGEPSVRKDLTEIIRTVKSTPGINKVAMTTNGYRLPELIDSWADAGLDALNVSIDSLDPAVFQAITGHSQLQQLLDGLERAVELGIPTIKVNAVMLKGFNDNQLGRFQEWLKHKPITLRFIELMQTGDNAKFFAERHVAGDDVRTQLLNTGWTPTLRGKDAGPAQEFHHPDYMGRVGLIMPYSKDFCATCNRLRVNSTGKLHLCLFSENGLDLRHLLQADSQQEELINFLHTQLADKKVSHFLQDGDSGGTRHLAMLGG
ncbi:MAG: GTP 3',8-cyclase MoaA [Porticoccaceae bacterium]|nr:GTP 3',8-cyclase MoaA [Porticoccaceae bacterium]